MEGAQAPFLLAVLHLFFQFKTVFGAFI